MNDSFNPKGKFAKFMEGKGFYIALALCVVGAGAAAWVAVDKTMSRIDESNNRVISQQQSPDAGASSAPQLGFPDLEEAGTAQSGVGVSSPGSASSSAPAASSSAPAPASSKAAAASQARSEESAPANTSPEPQPLSYVMPLSGEIFNPYSNGELVKNTTLKEWRTHDGIDIKADKGSTVMAVCAGQISSVTDDALYGVSVEILHPDGVTSVYCGLDKKTAVKKGDEVKAGQAIGVLGSIPCEISDPTHLHFAMKQDGKWLDPLKAMGKTSE